MNSNIQNNIIPNSDGGDKHQNLAMELHRLEDPENGDPSYKFCKSIKDGQRLPSECERIIKRYNELKPLVDGEREKDANRRELQKDTNPNNTFQKEKTTQNGIYAPNVTKSSNHSGKSTKSKILTNNEAQLNEEISNIRYLIEYMTYNNNNKKQNL